MPTISQYWDTEVVPDYLVELFDSFRDLNPDFDHRLFSETEAERFIGERFGPRELAAFQACAVPSMQSDLLRYCAVLALGGVYADADYRCLQSLWPFVDGLDGGEIFLGPTRHLQNGRPAHRIWSGFFGFGEPGHPLLELALEIAVANVEARIAERVWSPGENVVEAIWLTVGPGVLSLMRFIREWGSFDAFVEAIAGSPAEPFGPLYCEVIGDYERLLDAFEGVRVSTFERMQAWVEDVPWSELAYKDSGLHWHNVTTSIFR